MQLIRTIAELRSRLKLERQAGKTVGLVPTMGYLHIGHLALVKAAQKECDISVVSIFVNPTQFGEKDDLAQYPRDLDNDLALLEKQGADYVFAPDVDEIYPDGNGKAKTFVEVEGLSSILMGEIRPGHFRGVATVVSKLFNIVQPDQAFFGEKDFQQLAVIRRMVRDLNQPVTVVGVPTMREEDGLAFSSRNSLLSKKDRAAAVILPQAWKLAQQMVDAGERSVAVLYQAVVDVLAEETRGQIEAVDFRNAMTLEPVTDIVFCQDNRDRMSENAVVLLLSMRFGKVRLIDEHVLRCLNQDKTDC